MFSGILAGTVLMRKLLSWEGVMDFFISNDFFFFFFLLEGEGLVGREPSAGFSETASLFQGVEDLVMTFSTSVRYCFLVL
jgi:hypothetical protein